MIKFFRKIRQNLLTENGFSKYLLYAIGEIILVVIGILIALQINNWNNNRIATNQMTDYLLSLKHDLQADTVSYSKNIEYNKEYINRMKYLKLLNFEDVPTDSLSLLIIPNVSLTEPVQTTFSKLVNSGITQVSDNDSLSQKVYEYYTNKLNWVKVMNSYDNEETMKDLDYWIREQGLYEFEYPEIPTFQNDIERRDNLVVLLSGTKVRNNLKEALNRKKRIVAAYQRVKNEAIDLIIDIEKELEKR